MLPSGIKVNCFLLKNKIIDKKDSSLYKGTLGELRTVVAYRDDSENREVLIIMSSDTDQIIRNVVIGKNSRPFFIGTNRIIEERNLWMEFYPFREDFVNDDFLDGGPECLIDTRTSNSLCSTIDDIVGHESWFYTVRKFIKDNLWDWLN